MTDINTILQQWQHDLGSMQEDEKKAVYQKEKYAEKLDTLDAQYHEPKGLWRHIKKPFVYATRAPWMRRKTLKLDKHIAADENQIKNIAKSTLSNLADTVARGSAAGKQFEYLEIALREMKETQAIVKKAAKKLRNASVVEGAAAVGEAVPVNIGGDNDTAAILITQFARAATAISASVAASRAKKAFSEAQEAVQSLEQTLQQQMIQVNGAHADNIAMSNSNALMMDMFGGILASFANWNMARQLNKAKGHLNDVADQLGNTINTFSQQKAALSETALREGRKSDNNIEKFAAQLEDYMLPAAMRKSPPGIASPEKTSIRWE